MPLSSFKVFLAESESINTTDISPEAKKAGRAIINRIANVSPKTASALSAFFMEATKDNFVEIYNSFVLKYPREANLISRFRGSQTGPGEMIFYYLFDNIGVGRNLPIDLFIDNKPFAEVKAGSYSLSEGKIYDFILGGSEIAAVQQFKSDLKTLNSAHKSRTGEDLPGWKGESGDLNAGDFKKWREMEITSDGGETSKELILYADGDLKLSASDVAVMNVKKSKSVKPLVDLIDSEKKEPAKNAFSIEDAIKKWAKGVEEAYLKNKLFILLDAKTLKIVHVGYLTAKNIDVYRIARGDVKAAIYFKRKPQD